MDDGHNIIDIGKALQQQTEAQQLQSRQREIVRRHMLGMDHETIAQALGICKQTVSNCLSAPQVKAHVESMQNRADLDMLEAHKQLQELIPAALEVYQQIVSGEMEGATPHLRAKVAADLMDRTGMERGIKVNTSGSSKIAEEIEAMKERCRRAKESILVNATEVQQIPCQS